VDARCDTTGGRRRPSQQTIARAVTHRSPATCRACSSRASFDPRIDVKRID